MAGTGQLQLRRGTDTQVAAFTGAAGEVTPDMTNNRLVLHDGTTAGGHPQASEAYVDDALAAVPGTGDVVGPASATDATVAGFDGTTGKLVKELTAAEVRTAAGASTVGSAVFTATDAAAALAAIGVSVGVPDVIVEEQFASGTQGGAFTGGESVKRALNTLVRNVGSIASLASNQVTLGAGTYYFKWSSPAVGVDQHKSVLQNVTDTVNVGFGTSEYANTTVANRSEGSCVVTIAGSKAFAIFHIGTTTHTTNGLGVATNIGGLIEVYARLEITKLS